MSARTTPPTDTKKLSELPRVERLCRLENFDHMNSSPDETREIISLALLEAADERWRAKQRRSVRTTDYTNDWCITG